MPQKLTLSMYDAFSAVRTHIHSNGLALMPVAAQFPAAAQVVALHGGLDFDAIAYTAVRRGEPPVIPDPHTTNPNRIFLGGGRSGALPMVDVQGIVTYSMTGWFLFGILSPEALNSDFMLGNLPFPGIPANEYIPGTYFSTSIINQTPITPLVSVPTEPSLIKGITDKD